MLVLVNSNEFPVGNDSISTRPGSAASLPISTTSRGLLCLLVGVHVHRVRSDTEASAWPLPRAQRTVRDIYIPLCDHFGAMKKI